MHTPQIGKGRSFSRLRTAALVVGTVTISAIGLTACGSSSSSSTATSAGTSTTAASGKHYKVGFLLPVVNESPFTAAYKQAATVASQRLGIEPTFLDSNFSASTQLAQARELIAKGVDGIVLFPSVASGSLPILLAAKAGNVPLTLSDSLITGKDTVGLVKAFTGVDSYQKGVVQAKQVAGVLKGNGTIGIVSGKAGFPASDENVKGVTETLKKIAPGIKVVAVQPGNYTQQGAQSAASSLLTRFPNLSGIVSLEDAMSVGVAQAIQTAGKPGKVKLFGLGYQVKQNIENIKSGLQTTSVLVSPCWEGVMATKSMYQVLAGKPVAPRAYMPLPSVTKANQDQFQIGGCVNGITPETVTTG